MMVELYRATSQGARARQMAMKLAEKYPESFAAVRLRQEYGVGFEKLVAPPPVPPAPGPVATGPAAKGPVATRPAGAVPPAPAGAPATPKVVPDLGGEKMSADDFGTKLGRELTKFFTDWRISNGSGLVSPYAEVKRLAGVTGMVADDLTRWEIATTLVSGQRRDQLLVAGQVRMAVKGPGGGVQWIAKRATILLASDGRGNMLLQQVRLAADPPRSIGPPPPLIDQ
jgi:hypothetical protein